MRNTRAGFPLVLLLLKHLTMQNVHEIFTPFLSAISPVKQAIDLEQKLIDNNNKLMSMLNDLAPEDQKEYAEKVYNMVKSTQELVHNENKKVLL
jgi:hypothetical protein